MPVNSSTALNGMSVTVQAVSAEHQKSLMSTISQQGLVYKDYLASDSMQASNTNYQDVYKNPDLESILIKRGFSQLRPEIIGCFEFIPPVTEEIFQAVGALTQETYSTASAEMFDLQCQLKQLRYAEVLEFFNIMLNLPTKTLGEGVTLDDESEGASYLEPFSREMQTAKEILDFLTVAYNTITAVLRAMDVKNNDYTSRESNSNSSSIYSNLDLFNEDKITVAPNNISLKEYLIGSKIALDLPDSWWDTATPTTIVSQLVIDAVIRLLYPIGSWTGSTAVLSESWESRNPGASFEKGTVLGLDFVEDMKGNTENLDAALYPFQHLSLSSVAISASSATGTTGFSKGDFLALRNTFFKNSLAFGNTMSQYGDAIYNIASDWMLAAFINENSDIVRDLGIGASDTVDTILKKIFGVKPETLNIADINPNTNKSSMIMKVLPKDEDRSSSTPGKISSFQFSSYELPNGSYPLRTGKSYYLDEIVTSEITDVIDRLSDFESGLNSLVRDLTRLGQRIKCPEVNNSNKMPGLSGRRGAASYLLHKMWIETKDSMVSSLGSMSSPQSANENYREFIKIAVLSMASEDTELAWYLFQYSIYKHAYKYTYEGTYKTFALAIGQTIADYIIENNRGIYGASDYENNTSYEHGGREELHFGSGGETLGPPAGEVNLGISAVYAAMEAADPTSMTSEEIYDMFVYDVSSTKGLISSGYAAANGFADMITNAYGGTNAGFNPKEITGPRFNSDILGVVGILFFFQMHVWKNALSWRQIPGFSASSTTFQQ